MVLAHKMTLREAFYILVLEEIRSQPGLSESLGNNDLDQVISQAFGHSLDYLKCRIDHTRNGPPDTVVKGQGLEILPLLTPPSNQFLRPLIELYHRIVGVDYQEECRSALLDLFWGKTEAAERRARRAITQNARLAFGHHVLGLTLGMAEDVYNAKRELQLASELEGYESVKKRIQRALRLVK